MNRIETLDQLIDVLNQSEPEEYVKVARRMRIPLSEFEKYTFWKEDCYTRNCIERTSVFELILICWNPGDETPIHGHDEQRCWVYQADGEIREIRYDNQLAECHRMVLTTGCLSYMEDEMGYHSLKNCTEERAMTLHLYISPIDSCKIYDDDASKFKTKELQYDSFRGVYNEAEVPR